MEKSRISFFDKIILFCLFVYFSSSFILITFSWGKYIMLFSIILMFGTYILKNKGIIYIPKTLFFRYTLAFLTMCIFSIVWAWNTNAAVSKCITIAEILICVFCIVICTDEFITFRMILKVVLFSAYAEAVFLLIHFGISNLFSSFSVRLTNEVGNSNFISMLMAVSIIIAVSDILFDKFKIYHLCSVLTVFFLAISQSRTALIGTVVGVLMLFYFKAMQDEKMFNRFVRLIVGMCILILLLYLVLKLPLFSALNERMYNIWVSITGKGTILNGERSISIRRQMIDIGIIQIKRTPLFGIGIGNSFMLLIQTLGENTYLHNNFIELAVDTGIIGAMIYYSIYLYILKNLYKYRNYKNEDYYICLTLLIVQLLMDFGAVSYYTKDTYIYFFLYFTEIKQLRKATNTLSDGVQ